MPKTDDGFQGWRPAAYGDVWDEMTSPERRRAFVGDLIAGVVGAIFVAVAIPWIMAALH